MNTQWTQWTNSEQAFFCGNWFLKPLFAPINTTTYYRVVTQTTKSVKQAQAVLAELDRRAKPQLDAEDMARKAVCEKIIARAKELRKACTADADEKLISALQALS